MLSIMKVVAIYAKKHNISPGYSVRLLLTELLWSIFLKSKEKETTYLGTSHTDILLNVC